MHNQNIKILRLNDGEDIITDYHLEEGNIVVMNNPMTLFFKRLSVGKSMVLMQPWLPVELVDVNCAKIFANQILTVIEPKPALVEYYKNSVDESNQVIAEYSKQIDESLLNDAGASSYDSEGEEEDYTEDDAFIDKMQESFNIKNKTIH
jgi:hypothetical protein